ncbi:MAG: ADP-ribose pyrophosphatase YjhB (NUDIX family) [Acidimicrobiales bacterium]
MNNDVTAQELLTWAESLAGIARTGLGFSEVPFERERYEEILAVAGDIRARVDGEQASDFKEEWLKIVGDGIAGYVTPKVAIGAVVGDDEGRLLLIQRADSGVWLYPTGWADIGYSPAEVAVKEVWEETGIRCEVVKPLAIHDGLRLGFSRIPLYSIVFHCRAVGGALSPHPQECLDAQWFTRDNLPEPIASFDRWGDLAFRAVDGDDVETSFDAPRDPVWRGDPHA